MPKKNTPKLSRFKKKLIVTAIAVLLIVALIFVCLVLFSPKNYAQQTAEPIEAALLKAGAVKKCERGDSGRGVDNRRPWYYAIYEMPKNKEVATALSLETIKNQGYRHLESSTNQSSGTMTYADSTSRTSPYSDLKSGFIGITLEVFAVGTYHQSDDKFCTITESTDRALDRTLMRVTLGLPEYK